jgi:SecD/SecF fusion protein
MCINISEPVQSAALLHVNIGLITSVFTGVFITRIIYEAFHAKDKWLDLKFHTRWTKSLLLHPKIDFIGNRKWGYLFSGVVLTLFVISLFTKGLNQGVDFSGGRNYIVRFDQPVRTDEIKGSLANYFKGSSLSVITIGSSNQVRINTNYRMEDDSETVEEEIAGLLYEGLNNYLPKGTTKDQFIREHIVNSQKVGPSIADDVKKSAYVAVFLAIIIIGLYILMRFRNVAFSAGAIAALFHDVLFIIGCYSVFSGLVPFSLEVDQNFIAALLTIIGYSVNDTVVIFDRIRENLRYYPKRNRKRVLNEALNQTLVRTFSTSLTVFVTILILFLFGGETIRGFSFAMLIGTIIGVYSTLFIACPIAYEVQKKQMKIVDDDYDDEKPLTEKGAKKAIS